MKNIGSVGGIGVVTMAWRLKSSGMKSGVSAKKNRSISVKK